MGTSSSKKKEEEKIPLIQKEANKEKNNEENEEKSEEIIAPIGNKQGILVFGGKNGRRIREEREEREEREKIDLEKIAKRLENKRDGEIRLEENSANNEEKIKKIKDKYEKIYKNYILKNEFLIKVKFGQNYKKELSPYIPALIQRKNFFLNNTLIGKIMREKKEKSKENEEKNEEESEKKSEEESEKNIGFLQLKSCLKEEEGDEKKMKRNKVKEEFINNSKAEIETKKEKKLEEKKQEEQEEKKLEELEEKKPGELEEKKGRKKKPEEQEEKKPKKNYTHHSKNIK